MPSIGPMELVIGLFLVIVVFGVGKLPEVGGAIGKGIKEFRKAQTGIDEITKPQEIKATTGDGKNKS